MEELYVEGLATHGDPESCLDDPRTGCGAAGTWRVNRRSRKWIKGVWQLRATPIRTRSQPADV